MSRAHLPHAADPADLFLRPRRRPTGRPRQALLAVAPELVARTEEPGFFSKRVAKILGVRRIPRQVTGSWRNGPGVVADNELNRSRLDRLASLLDFQGRAYRQLDLLDPLARR
jgi:hypothetical protein